MTDNTSHAPRGIATYVLFGGVLGIGINILIEIFWPAYLYNYRWLHVSVIFCSILALVGWREWRFRMQQLTKLVVKDTKGNLLAEISTGKTLNHGLDRVWIDDSDGSVGITHNPSEHIFISGRCAGGLEVSGSSSINVRARGDIIQNV